jgi:hypothetical protein
MEEQVPLLSRQSSNNELFNRHLRESGLEQRQSPLTSKPSANMLINDKRVDAIKDTVYAALFDDDTADSELTMREKLYIKIKYTKFGRYIELVEAVLNLLLCVLYIYGTKHDEDAHEEFPLWCVIVEVVLAFFIMMIYSVYYFAEKQRFDFIKSTSSVTCFLTVMPIFIAGFYYNTWKFTYMAGSNLLYVFPIRFMRLYQCLRVCLIPSMDPIITLSDIQRKSIILFIQVIFNLLFASAIIHLVEIKTQNAKISFFDAFYYATVSYSSGLSTHIIKDDIYARLLVIYVMLMGIILIPVTLSELLTMMRLRSKYVHSYKRTDQVSEEHVLVVGSFDENSL